MMHHIDELHIHQFRGLHNLSLLNTGQINLLIGGNNCGKTSVLEAVAAYCRPLDALEWFSIVRGREMKTSRVPVLEALKWVFPRFDPHHSGTLFKGETRVSGKGRFPIRNVTATFSEFLSDKPLLDALLHEEGASDAVEARRGADIDIYVAVEASDTVATSEVYTERFQLWEDERFILRRQSTCPCLTVNTITPHAHLIEQLQIGTISKAAMLELSTLAVPMLRMFDADIEDVQIWTQSGVRPALYIQHKRLGLAPLNCFGNGLRRALLIATTVQLSRNGMLLIDELETAIHPHVQEKIFGWLIQSCAEHNIQVFATTHSLETLDAILNASGDLMEMVVYRLLQTGNDTTTTRLDKALLVHLRQELGQEVRW